MSTNEAITFGFTDIGGHEEAREHLRAIIDMTGRNEDQRTQARAATIAAKEVSR